MKRIVLYLFAVFFSIPCAFSQGIPFRKILFDDAFLEAISEKKLVFVEARSSWNGSSYYLEEAGITGEDLEAFFDARFVCVQVDENTDDGKALAERYHIDTYPTFLILKINDEEQYRITGGVSADDLIAKVQRGLNPANAFPALEREYASGKMKKERMMDYFLALQDGYAGDPKCLAVGKHLLPLLSKSEKMLPLYWPLFSDLSIAPVPSADFTFLQKNLEKFRASIGRERVDAYLLYCYESLLSPFLALEAANDMKNHDLLDAIYFQVERGDLPGKELLLLEVQIARAYYERDYEQAFSLLEEHIALFPDTKLWTLTSSFQSIRMESKEQIARVARLGDKITGAIKDPELKEYLRAYFNIYKRLAATGVYWEDLSLEEALGQANARDIFLFVNCYQEGAAATMADTLFAQEHIGEFFNQHFVNLKIDMTKEAGASIGEQYRVKKFPTFLLFRPDGILHYKLTGVQDEATFIERIQAGLSGEDTAWDREQQYEEGERDPALIAALIASLLEDKPEEAAVVARDYMISLPDSARCDSLNWYIYEHPRLSPLGGDLFTYLLDHQGAFAGSVGKARVDSTIHARYMDKCTGILSGKEPLEDVELVNPTLPLKYASAYRELAAALEITKAFCARQGSEEEHLRGLFNACRRRVGNLSGEIAYRVGRPVLGYLAQHIDQTHLGEYNMLVNTFAKKIADAEQKSVLKSMVIPLPTD